MACSRINILIPAVWLTLSKYLLLFKAKKKIQYSPQNMMLLNDLVIKCSYFGSPPSLAHDTVSAKERNKNGGQR